MFLPASKFARKLETNSFSVLPTDILAGALSLFIVATFDTIVGLPLSPGVPKPINSVLNPTSSMLNTVTSLCFALIAPLSVGRRGGIPVGVKDNAQGIGSFII